MHKLIFLLFFLVYINFANAQELDARVSVNSNSISSNVSKSTFETLQTALNNFMSTRKWTADTYLPNEKIECSFLLTLQPTTTDNVYSATLTVQAARPVFNSSYLSPIINFQDKDIEFKYVQYQQLEFNDNNVSGVDPVASNLTAIFAYYAYMVLGFEYDSFSQKGGDAYFQKAQNVVNNAPDGTGVVGWKAFDGIRNRYWLAENMLNERYTMMHDIYYNYYRLAMDKMYDDVTAGRAEMINVLNQLNSFNSDNPNTMINQFFFQGKATELIGIFSKAMPDDKARASELLQKLDLTDAGRYKDELQ
jgi:hypothetical protein